MMRRRRRDWLARVRGDHACTAEPCRVRGRSDRRMTVVVGERQCRILRRRFRVPRLLAGRSHMVLVRGGELLRRRSHRGAAGTAVVADVGRVVDDGLVVDVSDRDIRDVVDGTVVEEVAAAPITALIADAGVAEAIGDAAVEADGRSPITGVECVDAIVPAPIAGRP